MKKLKILGIIRHALTFIGGALVVSGKLDSETAQTVSGAFLTIVGGIWSAFSPEESIRQTIYRGEVSKSFVSSTFSPSHLSIKGL